MAHAACVDLSAAICVVLDHSAVTLDLTLDGRWRLAEIICNGSDRMFMVKTVFDLSAVFQSEVRTFLRRRFN